jgi:hypothetical protein
VGCGTSSNLRFSSIEPHNIGTLRCFDEQSLPPWRGKVNTVGQWICMGRLWLLPPWRGKVGMGGRARCPVCLSAHPHPCPLIRGGFFDGETSKKRRRRFLPPPSGGRRGGGKPRMSRKLGGTPSTLCPPPNPHKGRFFYFPLPEAGGGEGEGEELGVVAGSVHPHPNPPPSRGREKKGRFRKNLPLKALPTSPRWGEGSETVFVGAPVACTLCEDGIVRPLIK